MALNGGCASFPGTEAGQEVVRNILDVMLRTPPPATRDEWSEGGLLSWCGAAEVRCRVMAWPLAYLPAGLPYVVGTVAPCSLRFVPVMHQANAVKPATEDASASQRRKRQKLAGGTGVPVGEGGSGAGAAAETVRWMSWSRQRRAFQCAAAFGVSADSSEHVAGN